MSVNYPVFNAMQAGRATQDGDHEVADFIGFLDELVRNRAFNNEEEEGIAKWAMTKGTESLSEKQLFHLRNIIKPYPSTCNRCGSPISWDERTNALDNGSLCSYCANGSNG